MFEFAYEIIWACLFFMQLFFFFNFRQCWKEVNDLEKKKEEVMKKGAQGNKKDTDSDEDLDETDLDEFLDWRSKKSR